MQIPQSSWERAIDVSQFNNQGQPIDWHQVVPILERMEPSITRVIVRASYGTNYQDPMFAHSWRALTQLGVLKGAYHAAVPGETPNLESDAQQQAAYFLSVVNHQGGIAVNDWPILDLEQDGGLTPDKLTLWASHFLSCVDAAVVHAENVAIFYSYPSFIANHMGILETLRARPLWIADYPGGSRLPHSAPPDVGDWTTYFGWQYTNDLRIANIIGPVDGSVFAQPSPTLRASSRTTKAACPVWDSVKGIVTHENPLSRKG